MKIKELKCINKLISKDLFIDFKEYIIDNKLAKEEEFNELTGLSWFRRTEKWQHLKKILKKT